MVYVLAQPYNLPSEMSHKTFKGSDFSFRYVNVYKGETLS